MAVITAMTAIPRVRTGAEAPDRGAPDGRPPPQPPREVKVQLGA
jgi:hypothetical protein